MAKKVKLNAVELEARAIKAGVAQFYFNFWRRGRLENESFLAVIENFEKHKEGEA